MTMYASITSFAKPSTTIGASTSVRVISTSPMCMREPASQSIVFTL